MAMKMLEALARNAVQKHGCFAVRIHHALGEVPPGEASVLVQVACPHRAAAFEACRFLIDRLKAEAPIWKREVWADSTTWSAGVPVVSSQMG
jgi:molybdopterin synthase catalytic subunit